jgi:hypothetical protein
LDKKLFRDMKNKREMEDEEERDKKIKNAEKNNRCCGLEAIKYCANSPLARIGAQVPA